MIYLDHAASSPLIPGVREAMGPWLFENCANPSALHTPGRKARQAIEDARERIARVLGCATDDVIFTSGGTEANNMVIQQYTKEQKHIIVSCIEHDSVLRCARNAELEGCEVTYVPPNKDGIVDPDAIKKALRTYTALVSVQAVNNELGTIQPIREIKQVIAESFAGENVPCRLHVDAVQAIGHIPVCLNKLGWDFLTLSAHKFGGPKGVGALCCSSMVVDPLLHGGGQEDGFRPGTENVAGIVGMATALEYAEQNRVENEKKYQWLCARFFDRLAPHGVKLNGSTELRTFSNINLLIPGVEAEAVLLMLDLAGICASAGSACNASGNHPSHVLKAIGLTDEEARSSLRLTMGPDTTWEDMDFVADKLIQIIGDLRRV